MFSKYASLITVLLALLLLSSCLSHAPAARIYVLPAATGEAAEVTDSGAARVTLVIPQFLRRVEMRACDAATGEVRACPGGLWAEPLQILLKEALTESLCGQTTAITCTAFAPDFTGVFQAAGTIEVTTSTGTIRKDFAFTLPPPEDKTSEDNETSDDETPEDATLLAPAAVARQYRDAVDKLSQLARQD